MATLKEYYDTDFPTTLKLGKELSLKHSDEKFPEIKVQAHLHFSFDAGAQFLTYFIPNAINVYDIALYLLQNLKITLDLNKGVEVSGGFVGEKLIKNKQLTFTKRVFIYSEQDLTAEQTSVISDFAEKNSLVLTFRSMPYKEKKESLEKPLAFISHDSRNKDLARKISVELQKRMCPVWFDEFSLNIGDSLRESIEKGIKECKKVVLILSPEFISNPGWTKTEFNSTFTRELIENEKLMLPIWKDVTKKEVFDYSPALADRVAIRYEGDIDKVVNKLYPQII